MLKLNKTDSKIVKWIQTATAGKYENRPVLEGIKVNGHAVAVDGCRLHAARVQGLESLEGIYNMGLIRSGDNILEPTPIEGNFPDFTQILPEHNENDLVFSVNATFLLEALKGMDKGSQVIIRVKNPHAPIEVFGKIDDQEVYSLIMPIHIKNKEKEYWRPEKTNYIKQI